MDLRRLLYSRAVGEPLSFLKAASQLRVPEEKALKTGMDEKSREFTEKSNGFTQRHKALTRS